MGPWKKKKKKKKPNTTHIFTSEHFPFIIADYFYIVAYMEHWKIEYFINYFIYWLGLMSGW